MLLSRTVFVNPLAGKVNRVTGIPVGHGREIGLPCPGREPSFGWGVSWNR